MQHDDCVTHAGPSKRAVPSAGSREEGGGTEIVRCVHLCSPAPILRCVHLNVHLNVHLSAHL
eukprot:4205286-Pyramimonas_sp.AAC.2